MKTTARDSWLIASLYGIKGQSVIVEDWAKASKGLLPTVRVIGPFGGEKYRFSALEPELVQFAKDILKWSARNTEDDSGVTAPEGGNDADTDGNR